MKKLLMLFLGIIMMVGMVSAAPFNLPTEWVLQPNGTTIDGNSNGWPDYADNALNASSSGDSNTLGGELPSYYLDYDNMNAGSISDGYIDSAATWNAKGGTGVCAAGFYVSEVNTTGVVCTADANTEYSAGTHISLVGTTFSVDLTDLGSALENSVLSSYQNITNIPTCTGTDKLTYDGTTLSCEADDDGSNTQLTEEQVQDFAWNVLGGTQDGITVSYNDTDNSVSFVVDPAATVEVNVTDLGDVSLNGLSNGQALVYNSTSGLWENDNVVVDLSNYYTKSETYNQSEIDAAIAASSGVWNTSGSDIYYNDGNVGIGTDSPSSSLEVRGTSRFYPDEANDYAAQIYGITGANRGGLYIDSGDDALLYLVDGSNSATTRLNSNGDTYFNGGNVGIGTATPSAALEVDGTVTATSFVGNGSGLTDVGYFEPSPTIASNIYYDGGYLGVGTNDPEAMLHLSGPRTASDIVLNLNDRYKFRGDGVLYWGSAAKHGYLSWDTGKGIVGATGSNNLILRSTNYVDIQRSTIISPNIANTQTPQNRLDVEGSMAVGSTYSGSSTAPTNGLIVEGDVGIGTNSPSTALEVDGTVTATSFAGNGSSLTGIPYIDTANSSRLLESCDYTGTCINSTGLQTAIVNTITYGTSGYYAISNGVNGLLYTETIPASDITGLDYFTGADITGSETAFDGWDKDASNDFSGSWNDLTDIPAGFADDVDNNTQLTETQVDNYVSNNGYLTSYTETDPVWTAASSNYYNKTQVYNTTEVYTKTESDNNFVDVSGDTMTGDLNMSTHNITSVDCILFGSGGKICGI